MNHLRKIAITLLAAVTAAAVGACGGEKISQRVAGDAAPQIPQLVDAQVLSWLDNANTPGATVAVTVDGRLVLSRGYGVSDLESGTQMEPWHRSRIGSVSKLITAIATLRLVEQGELDLDEHLYADGVAPLWGSDPTAPPGIVYSDPGVLANPGDYLDALVSGVGELWDVPDLTDVAGPDYDGPAPPYLAQDTYQDNVELALDWASQMRVRHLLSHTSGLRRSGSTPNAADMFYDGDESQVTYPDVHQALLAGMSGPPLLFQAGTDRVYSNHGFGLMGQIIAEVSGVPYDDFAHAEIFGPLGLDDVIAVGIEVGPLDVTPYDAEKETKNPVENPYQADGVGPLSTATGGWIMTAQDLVRVVCGIDDVSNNLRLLDHDTVTTMETVWYPDADDNQPLGWDETTSSGRVFTKNGSSGHGGARVTKYLPGTVSDVEINVAVAANKKGAPPKALLNNIADTVAGAAIPDDFDLFDHHPCYVPPDENLALPTADHPDPPQPSPGPELVNPAPTTAAPSAPPKRDAAPAPEPTRTTAPPPRVSGLATRTEDIWTTFGDITCGPTETVVGAQVRSGSELRGVELEWAIEEGNRPDQAGSMAMVERSSGSWSATLGPFDLSALPNPAAASPIILTAVVTDQLGQTASARTEITLHPCPPVAR